MAGVAKAIQALTRVPSQAAAKAAPKIADLIQQEFDSGRDPYGNPWKSLAPSTVRRKGHARPNIDTHDLENGIQVKPLPGAGIQITVGPDYAVYVQRQRAFLPKYGLPKAWNEALELAAEESRKDWASGLEVKPDV